MRYCVPLVFAQLVLVGLFWEGVNAANVPGGQVQKNPDEAEYAQLAKESLEKYVRENGLSARHDVVRVVSVTKQVVAGTLTRIDFEAAPASCPATDCELDCSRLLVCHAKVFVQVWTNTREIDVTCQTA